MAAQNTIYTIPEAASITLDPSNGEFQKLLNSAQASMSFTLAQPPAPDDGKMVRLLVFIIDSAGATLTTPITVSGGGTLRWREDYNGSPVPLGAAAHSGGYAALLEFFTADRGVNWYGRKVVFA